MEDKTATEAIEQCIHRMEENTPRIKKCLDQLTHEEVWAKPNDSSNSIGHLILHLCGNITQYVISSLGGEPDARMRDSEFNTSTHYSKEELFERINSVVSKASAVMRELDHSDILRIRSVQGFKYSAIGIVIHVTEHYSYHTGQIALLTKLKKNQDLGFYAGYDLNKKNVL